MIEKIIVNIFVAIVELFSIKECCKSFRYDKKVNFVIFVSSILLYLSLSVLATIFIKNNFILLMCNVIALFIFTLAYKIKLLKRILSIIIYLVLSISYEILSVTLISAIIHITPEQLMQNLELYLLSAILSKFLIYITVKIGLALIKPNSTVDGTTKNGLLNMTLPLASFAILATLSYIIYGLNDSLFKGLILFVAVLLILANFTAYAVYEYSIKTKIDIEKQRAENIILNAQQKEYEQLIEQQLRSNKDIHEIKHKLYNLRDYIDKGDVRAIDLVNELCNIYKGKELYKYTEISSVDALLNVKKNKAKEKGFDLDYFVKIDKAIKVDVMDMCMMIGNILDNALEHGVVRMGDNKIKFSFCTHNDLINIVCTNYTDIKYVKIGKSTKENKDKTHGYGLVKIEELAKKYDGNLVCDIKNGVFDISVLFNNCISLH